MLRIFQTLNISGKLTINNYYRTTMAVWATVAGGLKVPEMLAFQRGGRAGGLTWRVSN